MGFEPDDFEQAQRQHTQNMRAIYNRLLKSDDYHGRTARWKRRAGDLLTQLWVSRR
jgi:hypothetical protein